MGITNLLKRTSPLPMGEGQGVRFKSGFEQRGELLRAFQRVLQSKDSMEE